MFKTALHYQLLITEVLSRGIYQRTVHKPNVDMMVYTFTPKAKDPNVSVQLSCPRLPPIHSPPADLIRFIQLLSMLLDAIKHNHTTTRSPLPIMAHLIHDQDPAGRTQRTTATINAQRAMTRGWSHWRVAARWR